MDAVGGVDDHLGVSGGILGDFVDSGGAIAGFGGVVEDVVDGDCDFGFAEAQMRGLVFFVLDVREEDRGEAVEADFVVGFRVGDFFAVFRGF